MGVIKTVHGDGAARLASARSALDRRGTAFVAAAAHSRALLALALTHSWLQHAAHVAVQPHECHRTSSRDW